MECVRLRSWLIWVLGLAAIGGCSAGDKGGDTVIRHRPDGSMDPDGATHDGSARDGAPDAPTGPLEVTFGNLSDGDTLPYPIAILHGETTSPASMIHAKVGVQETTWPMRDGVFFAAVRLRPGNNTIDLMAGAQSTSLELNYEPQTNAYAVRFVYALAADGDGSFQAADGEPNDATSAKQRIALGGELAQSWLGEVSHRAGKGRRTFRILRTESGEPVVVELRSPLTRAELEALADAELWSHFRGLLDDQPDREKTVDLLTVAPSYYDADSKTVKMRPVLVGSRLATKGSTDLQTWAARLDEVPTRLVDGNVIDGTTYHDDSAGRQRAWANYSTTVGLVGYHAARLFGLQADDADNRDHSLLERGFDHFNRWFVVHEPAHAKGDAIAPISEADQPVFLEGNALWWSLSRYTSLEAVTYTADAPPTFTMGENILIEGSGKIALALYVSDGRIVGHDYFEGATTSQTIPKSSLRTRFGAGTTMLIRVMDDQGNSSQSVEFTL